MILCVRRPRETGETGSKQESCEEARTGR